MPVVVVVFKTMLLVCVAAARGRPCYGTGEELKTNQRQHDTTWEALGHLANTRWCHVYTGSSALP